MFLDHFKNNAIFCAAACGCTLHAQQHGDIAGIVGYTVGPEVGALYTTNFMNPSVYLAHPAATGESSVSDFRIISMFGPTNTDTFILGVNASDQVVLYTANLASFYPPPAVPETLLPAATSSGGLILSAGVPFGSNNSSAAIVGYETSGYLYTIPDLYSPVFSSPIEASNTPLTALAVYGPTNSNAIIAGNTLGGNAVLYNVDLNTVTSLGTPLATASSASISRAIAKYDVSGNSYAAIVGDTGGGPGFIYSIDLNNITSHSLDSKAAVTSEPAFLEAIAAYGPNLTNGVIVGFDAASYGVLYTVDLSSLDPSNPQTLTPIAKTSVSGYLNGIATFGSDHSQAAIVGTIAPANTAALFLVDLNHLNSQSLSTPAATASLNYFIGITLLPSTISVVGLKGNSLKLANYFFENAPYQVVWQMAMQPDTNHALKNVAPTRNASAFFAAQHTQLLTSQTVIDHLCQYRGLHGISPAVQPIAALDETDDLLAMSTTKIMAKPAPKPEAEPTPKQESTKVSEPVAKQSCNPVVSPWIGIFGDYAREHAQNQTPSFKAGAGGIVAACDYLQLAQIQPIGAGLAYAHTHLREDQDMGHANVDQGALFTYGTMRADKWYFDLALWGGYYHIHNIREIEISGFDGEASSSIHGWQAAPHFEVGYDCEHFMNQWIGPWLRVEPFAMADWVSNWQNKYRETGGGLYNFGQNRHWSSLLRSESGIRVAERIERSWGWLTFREKASYAYQKAFRTGTITTFLVGSPGFVTLTTLGGAQNLGVVELEFSFTPRCKKYPYGSLSYQGEFGEKFQSHQGLASIGLDY